MRRAGAWFGAATVLAACGGAGGDKPLETAVYADAAHGVAHIKIICGKGLGLIPAGTIAGFDEHAGPVAENGLLELSIPLTDWPGPGTYPIDATCKAPGQSGKARVELVITAASLENPARFADCTKAADDAPTWIQVVTDGYASGRSCAIEPGGRWPVTLAGPAGATLALPDGSSAKLDASGRAAATLDLGALTDAIPIELLATVRADALDELAVALTIGVTMPDGSARSSQVAATLGSFVDDLLHHRTERGVAVAKRASTRCALIIPSWKPVELVGDCATLGDVGVIATGVTLEPKSTSFVCGDPGGTSAPVTRAGEAYRLEPLVGGRPARDRVFWGPEPRAKGGCQLAMLNADAVGNYVMPPSRADIAAWVKTAMTK